MATLVSKARHIQIFNIPCKKGKEKDAKCTQEGCPHSDVVTQVQVQLPDGTHGIKLLERVLPGSITVLAQATVEIPDWMLDAPEVKAALSQKRLRLVKEERATRNAERPPPPEKKNKPSPMPAPSADLKTEE